MKELESIKKPFPIYGINYKGSELYSINTEVIEDCLDDVPLNFPLKVEFDPQNRNCAFISKMFEFEREEMIKNNKYRLVIILKGNDQELTIQNYQKE